MFYFKPYDWHIVMSTQYPSMWGFPIKPKSLSIHTIATLVNRDPLVVLEEMENSGLCKGMFCNNVNSPVFWLREFNKIGWITELEVVSAFKRAREYISKYPINEVKGFKFDKFFSVDNKTMTVPFDESDKSYQEKIEIRLKEYNSYYNLA